MKPPPDRALDIRGTGTDLPPRLRPKYGVEWMHVFVVATALGLLSTTLAWQFTRFVGKWPASVGMLVILNFAWWYLWALMAPSVVWLAQHVPFARGSLVRAIAVHLPSVIMFSFTHIVGTKPTPSPLITMRLIASMPTFSTPKLNGTLDARST